MASMTRFSPSSYPTLSLQVGKETESAWGSASGIESPKARRVTSLMLVLVLDMLTPFNEVGLIKKRWGVTTNPALCTLKK